MTTRSLSHHLSAVNHASKKLASSRRFEDVLPDVLSLCVEAVGAEGGTIYLHNREKKSLEFRHVLPESSKAGLQFSDIPDDFGVAGQVFQTRKSIFSVFDVSSEDDFSRKSGVTVRNMITVPLMMEDEEPIGVVQLINKATGEFNEEDQSVLETVSAVSTLAYLNWQLLDEQTRASQLLGMGRVAHDIKNMAFALEANITFSADSLDAAEKCAKDNGDPLMMENVTDLRGMFEELTGSIGRIKNYTTLMSDLSAGKPLAPDLKSGPLADTICLAAAYLESEARKDGISIAYDIQGNGPSTLHDEMYVFRIVQNLVSNAIKAVRESDSELKLVTVRYQFGDGFHILEVEDNGPGMTEETANRILTGNARSVWAKSAGSGWGTKIVLELAATHNAKVEIDSKVGSGTTFRVRFPAQTIQDPAI